MTKDTKYNSNRISSFHLNIQEDCSEIGNVFRDAVTVWTSQGRNAEITYAIPTLIKIMLYNNKPNPSPSPSLTLSFNPAPFNASPVYRFGHRCVSLRVYAPSFT